MFVQKCTLPGQKHDALIVWAYSRTQIVLSAFIVNSVSLRNHAFMIYEFMYELDVAHCLNAKDTYMKKSVLLIFVGKTVCKLNIVSMHCAPSDAHF